MKSLDRLDIPLHLGKKWVCEWPFSDQRMILPDGKHFIDTPFMAGPEQQLIDQGVSAIMSIGGRNQHLHGKNRSEFIDGGFLAGFGIPLVQMNREQCISSCWGSYESMGRPGIITSGAQEGRHVAGGDQWAQVYSQVPDQYMWITEGWGEIEKQNPDFMYLGGYDGCGPDLSHVEELKEALRSDQAALNYMLKYERGEHPYFKRQLYRWQHVTLNMYYRSATDTHQRYYELIVSIEIIKRALRAVGSNRKIFVYWFPVYSEFVGRPGEGYSAKFERDVPVGGKWRAYTFPSYSSLFHAEFVHSGLVQGNGSHAWGDTRISGKNPNVVQMNQIREEDGFALAEYTGGPAEIGIYKRPFDPNNKYPYPVRPVGRHDASYFAAQIYGKQVAHVGGNTNAQWLAHRLTNTADFCSVDDTYVYDRMAQNQPWAQGGQEGNRGWFKITAMKYSGKRFYDIRVPDGRIIPGVHVEGRTPNYYAYEF